jgi:hypothetical protein
MTGTINEYHPQRNDTMDESDSEIDSDDQQHEEEDFSSPRHNHILEDENDRTEEYRRMHKAMSKTTTTAAAAHYSLQKASPVPTPSSHVKYVDLEVEEEEEEEEPLPPQWIDQLPNQGESEEADEDGSPSSFVFLGDEMKFPGRETKKPTQPPESPSKQQPQTQLQLPQTPQQKPSLQKWIENKGSGDTHTTAEPTTLAASSTEYQAFLEDAEQNCDLLFLKRHAAQERTTENFEDYRCFAVVLHASYGMLLLHSSKTHKKKKKNKDPHYQVPGGRVEDYELRKHQNGSLTWAEQRYLGARSACARHLKDQTGLSFPPARLWPMILRSSGGVEEEGNGDNATFLMNEYKQRLFYVLAVTDLDFYTEVCTVSIEGMLLLRERTRLLLVLSVSYTQFLSACSHNKNSPHTLSPATFTNVLYASSYPKSIPVFELKPTLNVPWPF